MITKFTDRSAGGEAVVKSRNGGSLMIPLPRATARELGIHVGTKIRVEIVVDKED